MRASVRSDVRWGVGWGVAFAAAYSAIALVLHAFTGPARFTRIGVTLGTTIAIYMIGGICGGALLGLLRPLTRWRVGAMFVGVVVCVPLSLGFMVAQDGSPSHWREGTIAGGVLAAILIGGMAGYQSWEPPQAGEQGGR